MTTVVSLILVAGVIVFVAWPFVRASEAPVGAQDVLSPLERQKLDAYAAIREAEFDLRMGKLSEEDFAAISAKYRQQALAAISAIEEAQRGIRRASGEGRKPRGVRFCPGCGMRLPAHANFCAGCGVALQNAVA